MFKQPASISIYLEEASKAHCDEFENCFPEGQDTNLVKVSAPANFQHFILASNLSTVSSDDVICISGFLFRIYLCI